MNNKKPDCQLIGAGRTGRAISLSMTEAGYKFTWICSRNIESSAKLAHQIGIDDYGTGFEHFDKKAGFLLFAVPDNEIKNAVSEAIKAGILGKDTIAAHLSGALGSDVLDDIRSEGASVMAFHPIQTFTKFSDPSTVFKNICFDMEGDDRACALGEQIAIDLGAESIRLNPENRIVSHLAMTFASNYTVSLMRIAEDIMKYAGVSKR